MFESISDRSGDLIRLAREEAYSMDSEFIGTEHLLLALLKQENTGAAEILASMKVELGRVRAELKEILGPPCASHSHTDPGELPFSPACRRAISSAREFSLKLGEPQVTPEHILLGLMHESKGSAAEVLLRLGVRIDDIGREIVARRKRCESPPPSTGT